jgi:hypothetical protein
MPGLMLTCPQCRHANARAMKFCEACGASLQDVADRERHADEVEASFLLDQVRKARTALLIVGAVQAAGTLIMGYITGFDAATTSTMAAIAAVFFALAWWCRTNPFAAAVVGLVVFVTVHLAEAVFDPSSLARGVVMKVIVIAVLVRAIGAGVKYREFRRERGLT